MSLSGEFIVHSAGQGGFYSGVILDEISESKFIFVYDCGTFSKQDALKEDIRNFHKANNNKLNMLVISHLDYDHVNLLPKLLSEACKIDIVIMPYICILDMVKIMTDYNPKKQSKFYYEFISNPIAALNTYTNIDKFIFIIPNTEQDKEGTDSECNFAISDKKDNYDDVKLKINIKYNKYSNLENELKKRYMLDASEDKEKLMVISCNSSIQLVSYDENWIFKFWENQEQKRKYRIPFLKECIRKKININSTSSDISDILTDKNIRKELADIYKKYSYSINDTSLVLYHAPLSNKEYESKIMWFNKLPNDCSNICNFYKMAIGFEKLCNANYTTSQKYATLLTGDTDLNRSLQLLCAYFSSEIEDEDGNSKILMLSVPHHGSAKSWRKEFLDAFISEYCIIQAGYSSKFGHPSYEVLCALEEKNRKFFLVHEFRKIIYTVEAVED